MKSQLVLDGRFRVFEDGTINRIKDGVEKPATISLTGRGRKYPIVTWTENNAQRRIYVSNLIASAFLPNSDNLPFVIHKDGNPQNNHLDNLMWGTENDRVYRPNRSICKTCGYPTLSKSGMCPSCKKKIIKEERQRIVKSRRAARYETVDLDVCTEYERKYVQLARQGVSIPKISDAYGVSNQCVSAALRNAETKTIMKQLDRQS